MIPFQYYAAYLFFEEWRTPPVDCHALLVTFRKLKGIIIPVSQQKEVHMNDNPIL